MHGTRLKMRAASILMVLVLGVVMPGTTPALAADHPLDPSDQEVADALDYLQSEQDSDGSIGDFATSAWAAMAIAAAGEDPGAWSAGGNPTLVEYLEAHAGSAGSCTDYARMVLAIVAAEESPGSFGGRDFVALLKGTYDGSQMGDSSLLNDDFWAVMALVAAGEIDSAEVDDSVSFILANQNADGGWSWGVGQASDVDDTAAALMALRAAGQPASLSAIQDGLDYLEAMQMDNGGFESWGTTNAATNAWGVDGLVAAGEDPTAARWTTGQGLDPVDDLLSFQNADGSFNWTAGDPSNTALMTSYAIPALVSVPYPVVVSDEEEGVSVDVRIEGENDTVWSGIVTVDESTIVDDQGGEHQLEHPTALGALDEASQTGGFSYVVQDTAYGLYIYSIDGEEAAGLAGWMYRVDYQSPTVGAADFILDETAPPDPPHGEVLFAYSEWGEVPLRAEVDNVEPGVGEAFTVTVTAYNDTARTWSPCEGATVHAESDYSTGPNGTVELTVNNDMTLEVYAEKDGCIRSNRVTVTVGEGGPQQNASQGVGLYTDVIPAISFSVNPDAIGFGELGPRDTSEPHTITLTNEGAWDLLITAEVSSDPGDLYAQGLTLDGMACGAFNTTLARDGTANCDAVLAIPEWYALTGPQEGTLVFWASDAQQ